MASRDAVSSEGVAEMIDVFGWLLLGMAAIGGTLVMLFVVLTFAEVYYNSIRRL